MTQKTTFPAIYYQVVEVIKSSGGFLVGGAVRDLLLSNPIRDLDFALPGDTIKIARKVADQLEGDFFTLDQERQTARVILTDEKGQRFNVDFTLFQGGSIEEDLKARDFTITSMGMDILQEDKIIDPFRGAQDLKDGVIRSTTIGALHDDPLRCLRAVRLAAQFQLRILPETREQIRQHQHLLGGVSPERIRDELFRILAGPHQTAALTSLNQLGTYPLILPSELTTKQGRIIRGLETFWTLLTNKHDQDSAANLSLGIFVNRMGRYRAEIQKHLDEEPVPGRSIYQLSFLAPLIFSDRGDEQKHIKYPGVPLSNQENDRLLKSFKAANDFLSLLTVGGELPPLSVYRYFRSYGPGGVEGIFLGMADLIGEIGYIKDDKWLSAVDTARTLLEGWWDKRDQMVDPPPLLNGHDLQGELNIEPGPRVGQLLEELREAQVSVGLDSREKALDFIRQTISREGRS
jgi:tRNA nucleotidyltransferase/poly(A) polymerase